MQKPVLSSSVVWTDDLDNESDKHFAAIVTAVYDEMLDLFVFAPGASNGLPRLGVRHIADPNKEAIRNVNEGVWLLPSEHARMRGGEEIKAANAAEAKRRASY